ncbi:DUF3054 domain-containing protein [Mobilicoccus massiliensis]|uniref:DUF3054 domain-containing protein n=1 Tax=Mobilicoccus massiliensis TaxID=1522310 RepID=UPI0006933B3C|nr:DUF3054 domain-containing protein [Mobilicoccus massiliensis]
MTTSAPSTRAHVSPALAAVLDLVLIIVFAAIGRATHAESLTAALATAWPFVVGGAIGWLLWWAMRRTAPVSMAGGVVVWVCTVAGGMAVRALIGQGTALSFVVVASIATAILLLGWRALAALVTRRRGRERSVSV